MVHPGRVATREDPTGQVPEPVARIENPQGASPILLICEHASRHLPGRYGTLGLGPAELESHIAWDPGALGVAQALSRLLDAPLIHAAVSRLVLDPGSDELHLTRLKKRKLRLKDMIAYLENKLIPDLDA